MKKSLLIATLTASGLTACVADNGEHELARFLPDDRVMVNQPTHDAAAKDAADGEWSQYYLLTAQVTEDVNGLIGFVIGLVDHVTDLPPSYVDGDLNHAVWGPYSDALDPVETALYVQYHVEDDTYTWAFVQKPKGATDDDYVPVIVGEVDAGATDEAYSGRFVIDFDTLNTLDPTQGTTGGFVSEFDVQPAGVSASAAFVGMWEGEPDETKALYTYEQTHGGDGAMDLAWLEDLTGNGQEETHIVRSRWTNEGAGRSDAYVTDGQLGDEVGTVNECWDTSFNAVYNYASFLGWEEESGDLALCVWDAPEYDEEAAED